VFREGCGAYDLRLPMTQTLLPLRAYHYIGSLPALPFAPLWAVLRDPVAARVQGALFLTLACALLARLVGSSFGDQLLAALVFPAYALAFVADLGAVGLSLVLLGRRCWGCARPCARTGRPAGWGSEPRGAHLLPGLLDQARFRLDAAGVRDLRVVRSGGPRLRRLFPVLLAAAGGAFLPGALLLAATDADGQRYLQILREGNFSLHATARDLTLHPFLRLSRYLYDGCAVLPRTLDLPHAAIDGLPAMLAVAIALQSAVPIVRGFLALAAATGVATLVTRNAWGPHHAAFALFFLSGALGAAVAALRQRDRRLPLVAASIVAGFWLTLLARLPLAAIHADTDFGKDRLLGFVRAQGIDRSAVVAHTSWGTFYTALLFGDPLQIAVWTPGLPHNPDRIAAVREIAAAEGRGIAVISQRPHASLLSPELRAAFATETAEHAFGSWLLPEFPGPPKTVGRPP